MKKIKYSILIILLLAISFTFTSEIYPLQIEDNLISMSPKKPAIKKGAEQDQIKTAYKDLPESEKAALQSLLMTSTPDSLEKKSIIVMAKFLENKLLRSESPFGRDITSNYFLYIYNALPDFVDPNERHQGYYMEEAKGSAQERLMAYAIYRIDRSPENIEKLFEYARPFIRQYLTPAHYESYGISRKVLALLGVYNELENVKNFREKLLAAAKKCDSITGMGLKVKGLEKYEETKGSAYGFSSWDLSELICSELGIDRHSPYYGSPEWSFWMRRAVEGNMDTVHAILMELNSNNK